MQKMALRLLLLLTIFVGGNIFAYAGEAVAKKGVIRVKLQPEVALQLGKTPRMQTAGVLKTGITPLDASAKAIKAYSIRRVFPYAPKFEAQRAKYGLDRWYEITFDEGVTNAKALSVLKQTAGVQDAHCIVPMELKESTTFRKATAAPKAASSAMPFNDPRLPSQWHYFNDGSLAQSKAGADINLFEAWKITTGSNKVTVAIIDGGIDMSHEDLAANVAKNEAELNGKAGVDDDGNGYIDDIYGWNFCTNSAEIYPHDHGTHVAGTVAAVNNNGIGVAGVAGGDGTPGSGIKMISVQVFDSRSGSGDADFAAALVYAAERGATIAQCSWGWGSADYKEQSVLDAIDYFTDAARSENMNGGLCIFAAGNDGATGNWYPGCYEPVVAVAAMGDDLTPTTYSNYGEWVDVVAPGGLLDYGDAHGILSTLPDNSYGFSEGTSMATPHVSGIAALFLSKHGKAELINETLRQQLITSVNDFYTLNPAAEGLFGSGYVDAAKALAMGDGTAPSAVSSFSVYPGQDNVTLGWIIPASSDNNVNNHILYYSKTAFDANSDLSAVSTKVIDTKFLSSGDSITYELTGLESLTTYYFAMKAVNRWGNASELSPVVSATTNAGPKMTIDKSSISLTVKAGVASAVTFNVGNQDEGLLKWNGLARTTQQTISTRALNNRPLVPSVKPFNGKLSSEKATTYAVVRGEGFHQDEYPVEMAYFDAYYASIGETDTSLPNSAAQWFYVDPNEYPEGFNLTAVKKTSFYGESAVVQIYKGSNLTQANLAQEITPTSFYSDMVVRLNEQMYFAPGESFWVVYHFPAQEAAYPLGLATAKDEAYAGYSYMSNDMGKTWVKVVDVLKGSAYEALGNNVSWAITAMSQNPDWSEVLVLNPNEGSVKYNEKQEVSVTTNGEPLINGTYKFNIRFNTNESAANQLKIPVTLTVSGNTAKMKGPKIVDFGNLLVGQEKTLTVEVYNEGYGIFGYYGSLSGNRITCSSANFKAPSYISGGFPARATSTFEVTFAPQEAGSLTGVLTFKNGDNTTYSITLQGVATEPAKIVVDPAEVKVGDLAVGGEEVKATFNIKNEGKYPLEYVFPKFSNETIEGSTSKAHKFGYTALTNLNGDTTFAYDGNSELIGATDITSVFSDDNYFSKPISLGFAFPFYGKTYENIYINSFGGLQFAIGEYTLRAPVSESSYGTENVGYISAYGYQLQFGPDSKIEYAKQDGKFVVKYSNVLALVYDQEYTPVSFRIALSSNGDIEVFYDSYDPMSMNLFQEGSTLYCGILDPACADALTMTSADIADYWGQNDDPAGDMYVNFTNQSSVKFVAPKPNMVTALSSTSGVVNPGETAIIEATLKADETMNAGENFNNIVILSNDPVNGTAFVKFTANIVGDELLPVVALESNDINFGKVFRTSDTKVVVTLKNTGKKVMEVTEVKAENNVVTFEATVPFAIEPGMSKDIVVTIPTENEGAVADAITVVTNAGEVKANIAGEVIGVPTLDLSYNEIKSTLNSGDELKAPLTITNNGNETLLYSITPNPEYISFSEEFSADSKVSYAYTASIDGAGAKYDWVDIETTGLGEQNNFTYYNSHDFVAVELPFEFPFYGKKYSKMYVYNTGFVSFTERNDDKVWPEPPAAFPGGTVYTNLIAPYWGLHTMDQTKSAGTYHYVTENEAIISWMEYGNTMNMGVCYQLIMRKDGSFKFQYKGLGDYAVIYSAFGLAGLSNEDGSNGVKIPERYIQFGNAVEFTPVVEVAVAAGENRVVDIEVLTDKLAGVYNSAIKLNSNIPGKEKVELPIELTINGVAKPVFPTDTIVVERIIGSYDGYREDLPAGGVTGMGAMYEAGFKIENQGTAAFTITNVVNGGPSIYDDWFDMYTPIFSTYYYAPELDWITGEPTGNYAWTQYYDYLPVTVDNNGVYFTIPMIDYTTAYTPGVYDIPLTFHYNESDVAVVNVRFIVTPAPVASLDKSEIRVENATDSHKSVETVTLSNVGQYKMTYELRMDPTGVGEVLDENDGGGIAPMEAKSAVKMLSVAVDSPLRANINTNIVPMAKSTNVMEAPQDFEHNSALFYPVMPGNNTTYQYGAGNTYSQYKTATAFVAPEEGFNISHIYTATYVGNLTNVDLVVEVVRGAQSGDPTTGTVVGKGTFHIDSMNGANFIVMALDKAVYMNPNEEFHVIITYPVGVEYPGYLCYKEEAVVSNRYMAYVEGYGWFDLATMFKEDYGSLGHLVTCLETVAGDAWVKLLNEPKSGVLEAPAEGGNGGSTGGDDFGGGAVAPLNVSADSSAVELQIQIDASAAPLVKGNKAVLVIKTSDPTQPVINFPIYLDKNGAPVITAPTGTVYAKEAEKTTVNVVVADEDGDDFTLAFSSPAQLASIKSVTAVNNAELTFAAAEDGTYAVSGASQGVNVEIEIAPNYGDAGKYAFTLTAVDAHANEAQAIVNYEVEHVNRAPEAVAVEDIELALDAASPVISYETMFIEPDEDKMTYTMTLSNNGVVTAFTTESGVIFVGTAEGEVEVTVVATDVYGASTSNTFKVIVSRTTGIDENSLNAKVEVYPNPVAETLYVTCGFSANETAYTIYAANGAKVYSSVEASAQGEAKAINVAELAEGVYILQVATAEGTATFHVVKK